MRPSVLLCPKVVAILALSSLAIASSHQLASSDFRQVNNARSQLSRRSPKDANLSPEQQAEPDNNNDIIQPDDPVHDRIKLGEMYKSLFKTAARFTLDQTSLPKYVKTDTAMVWIDNIAYKLSKLSTLVFVGKAIAISFVSLLLASVVFPAPVLSFEATFSKYGKYISRMDDNFNLEPNYIIDSLTKTTEEALERWGLHSEKACRERSICMIGEITKCTFPKSSEVISNFVTENLPPIDTTKNKYLRAFSLGFNENNCGSLYASSNSRSGDQANEPHKCTALIGEITQMFGSYFYGSPASSSSTNTSVSLKPNSKLRK